MCLYVQNTNPGQNTDARSGIQGYELKRGIELYQKNRIMEHSYEVQCKRLEVINYDNQAQQQQKDQSLYGDLQDLLEETDLNERPPCRQTDQVFNLENEHEVLKDAWTKEKPKPSKFIDNRILQRPPSRHKTPPKAVGLELPPQPCTPPENDNMNDIENGEQIIQSYLNNGFGKKKQTEWGPMSDDSSFEEPSPQPEQIEVERQKKIQLIQKPMSQQQKWGKQIQNRRIQENVPIQNNNNKQQLFFQCKQAWDIEQDFQFQMSQKQNQNNNQQNEIENKQKEQSKQRKVKSAANYKSARNQEGSQKSHYKEQKDPFVIIVTGQGKQIREEKVMNLSEDIVFNENIQLKNMQKRQKPKSAANYKTKASKASIKNVLPFESSLEPDFLNLFAQEID